MSQQAEQTTQTNEVTSETLLTQGVTEQGQDKKVVAAGAEAKPDAQKEPATEGGGQQQAEEQKEETDPLKVVPETADGYEIKLPSGVQIDEELLGSFKALAHEQGIPQGAAQSLAELYAKHTEVMQKQQAAAVEAWEEAEVAKLKASPTFDADLAATRKVLTAYGSPELYEVLDQTRIGSHPALFAMFAKIGKDLEEPSLKGVGGGGGELTAEEIVYPNMNKGR